ncbi:MAG: response regulator [Bacteriovoracaceae bacterium]|jgi:CheY-like chemotaxis protein|nr:response regulator [Bacteriovoracaceae bacterium]
MNKIVLIEDDVVMRQNTCEILELAGYKVETAQDGAMGVSLVQKFLPDLIVCDIMMPKMNGFEVFNTLAASDKTNSIPFIFLTAKSDKGDVREGMAMGADDYITKPFEADDLVNAIKARLNKKQIIEQNALKSTKNIEEFIHVAEDLTGLTELTKDYHTLEYKKKGIVYDIGQRPQYLYFLEQGKVKSVLYHEDGKEYLNEIFLEGSYFGIESILLDRSYLDSCIAMESSKIKKIPLHDFLVLVYKNPSVSKALMAILANNCRDKEEQLLSMAYNSVKKRTAICLVSCAKKESQLKENIEIKITRDDLANMVGTATETVIRCLSSLKDEGLIIIKGRKILIPSLESLANS